MRPADLLPRLAPTRLTARGALFLVAAGVGFVVAYAAGWPALLAVSLFLGGAVLAAVVVVVGSPASLTVEREVEPGIAEQLQDVRVRVRVRGSAPGALEWSEELPRSVSVAGSASGVIGAVRADRPAPVLAYGFTARQRGEVRIGPLRVARTDPLGLAATHRRVGAVERVVVLPRIHAVDLPFAVRRTDPDARASTVFGAVGDQRDIVARDYRAGDPLRSVDWRATARRGELMVRSETAASTASTGLVLDTRSDSWAESAVFEWAVEYAASLVVALEERQAEVRLEAGHGVLGDATSALVGLATVQRATGAIAPAQAVPTVAKADVQVVHVITGRATDTARLPSLSGGAVGLVSIVSRSPAVPDAPPGWRVVHRDPGAAVGRSADA